MSPPLSPCTMCRAATLPVAASVWSHSFSPVQKRAGGVVWGELTGLVGGIPGGSSAVPSGPAPLYLLRTQRAAASASSPPRPTSFWINCKLISMQTHELLCCQVRTTSPYNTSNNEKTLPLATKTTNLSQVAQLLTNYAAILFFNAEWWRSLCARRWLPWQWTPLASFQLQAEVHKTFRF